MRAELACIPDPARSDVRYLLTFTDMLRQHSAPIRHLLQLGDLAAAFVAFAAANVLGDSLDWGTAPGLLTQLALLGVALVGILIGYRVGGIYQSGRLRPVRHELLVMLAATGAVGLMLLMLAGTLGLEPEGWPRVAAFAALHFGLVSAAHLFGRWALGALRARGYNTRFLLLVTDRGQRLQDFLGQVDGHSTWGVEVVGAVTEAPDEVFLASEDNGLHLSRYTFERAEALLDHRPVDELWVDGFPEYGSSRHRFAKIASERGIHVRFIFRTPSNTGPRWGYQQIGEMDTVAATRTPADELSLTLKRALDVGLSSLVLLLASPVLLLAAIAVALDSPGPILFRQERVGLNGRRFTMYKFRSMVQNAESLLGELRERNEMSGPVFKMKRDPRVTKVGNFLRRTSIDELPQLFNVIRGEMSLVGPRPPLPSEVDLYQPEQRRRLSVKPGITGLWQVSGRNEVSDFSEWLHLDLEYIDRWSLALDLRILAQTLPAVLMAKGAR